VRQTEETSQKHLGTLAVLVWQEANSFHSFKTNFSRIPRKKKKSSKNKVLFFVCTYLGKQNALTSTGGDVIQDVLQLMTGTAVGTIMAFS